MNRTEINQRYSDLAESQREWIVEFFKNRFNTSAVKIREAIRNAGTTSADIEKYLYRQRH